MSDFFMSGQRHRHHDVVTRSRTFDRIFSVAVAGIVVIVVVVAWAMFSADGPNERSITMCWVQGGVPILDKDGLITRCDFPVIIRR